MSKRWTFILDPALKIQWIEQRVDPIRDAQKVIETLEQLYIQPALNDHKQEEGKK